MESNYSYYFLSKTAIEIWQKKDTASQNKMFECLYKIHKEAFFRRVIFRHSFIHESILKELAENAFLTAWESFNNNGKAGKIIFAGNEYTGYFYIVFKNHYLKLLQKENTKALNKNEFEKIQHDTFESRSEKNDGFSARTQMVLSKMSPDCRDLLNWKHIEGMSHDEIAKRKNINRDSSIKMVSRCGKRFLETYKTMQNDK